MKGGTVSDDVQEMSVGTGVISKPPVMLSPKVIEAMAGFSAGFTTTLLAHPLDFLKLRLQLDTQSTSQIQAVKKIYHDLLLTSKIPQTDQISTTRFIQNLYRGIGPNLFGSTSAWALYFYFYRQYKNLSLSLSDLTNDSSLKSWHYLISAFAAGWTTSTITNPIWVIKTRMISTAKDEPGAYKSMVHGIKQIFKDEGFIGFYRGLTPALLNVSQGAVQLSLYDIIKQRLITDNKEKEQRLSTMQYFYASSVSKMLSTGIFYPLQVVRSRLQIINNSNKLTSLSQLCVHIYRVEGVRAFYKGLLTNLFRVVPATCTTFIIYEKVKELLE